MENREAANKQGAVSLQGLAAYVADAAPLEAKDEWGPKARQHPELVGKLSGTASLLSGTASRGAARSETIKLFNGMTLDGWEGDTAVWSIKDGVIVGRNKDDVRVSTYLLTRRTFTDFRLIASAKLVESEMHSGICFWGRKEPEKGDPFTYAGHLLVFPSPWGMWDLFGRNSLPVDGEAALKVGKQHDWNQLEILARGGRVRVAVNGVQVVDWRDPEPNRIKEGPIGLQLHSNKATQEVQFKDLTVTTFPEDALITVK